MLASRHPDHEGIRAGRGRYRHRRVRDVARFPGRDHFAAYNGTAPVEVSSGSHKVYRLSRRGNRRLNHVIHMAAVTQVRRPHSQGRACYGKKLAAGKTPKEAF